MSVLKINPRNAILLIMILVTAAMRLFAINGYGPLTVFTPIGAMALFGGAYFTGNVKPFAFPLLTLFISDLVLSFTVYSQYRVGLLYSGWYWTYGAFALMTIAGKLIIRDITIKSIVIAVIVSTLIHWLVSDIGGCLVENKFSFPVYYTRLITAIPYELRFLAGTAIYSTILFGAFEWLQRRYTSLQPAH
ncbi:hypothetical protein A4H97_03450 [Niastella yeongjuensis]|uniref:Uncharacterized protein n=1 Tax=Niastella yeongjuensis TaxID=354355 RepID=A0A1V9EXP3_9BACT|nr:DUF6580 family putative transport protein [Niastella yeongjuensis]OQP50893.1 hypothetical protein A4H97_03450 [Niastella yeongjuensis]SEN12785.1 hypothetical protein SAMN05660816_00250 [Niastella yeongjuensis]